MKQLLIASAEDRDVGVISQCFTSEYRIRRATDKPAFVTALRKHHPDLAFIDVRLILDGRESLAHQLMLQELKAFWEANPAGPIIVLAPPTLLREAVKAVKAGASNYLISPIDPAEVSYVAESVRELERVELELDYLRGHLGIDLSQELCQTNSPLMREVLEKIKLVGPTKTTVLLTGETGVGKSTLAKLTHGLSTRASKQFIAVHCGAIPDSLLESELFGHEKGAFTGAVRRKRGKFEVADGGTIFLDEVGLLTPAAQIKLLGVIQDRCFHRVGGEAAVNVDVRIVAATNIDLMKLCAQGLFRQDLYYRINVFPLEIPPLRERKEDIALLTLVFLKRLKETHPKVIEDLHPAVIEVFERYDWPGNVRELENLVERAFILETSRTLTPQSFPAELFAAPKSSEALPVDTSLPLARVRQQHVDALEREYLEALLRRTRGRIGEAAQAAGVGVRQLHKLLSKHDLHKEQYRQGGK